MSRRIITSLLTILVAAVVVVGATRAFFSDTETSRDNVLAAGDIDLKIDNDAWYNGVFQPNNSWSIRDLTIERFFDYRDLKPGDWEEDTISIHVGSNPAWLCANAQVTLNHDNGITEPEDEAGAPSGDGQDGTSNGDLAEELNFMFWVDDGDNVFETETEPEAEDGEQIFLQGPLSGILGVGGGTIALADSEGGVLGLPEGVPADEDFYIGKAFCYGDFVFDSPVPQDGLGNAINPGGQQGPGFSCDGEPVGNLSQTDVILGNLSFYAEQVRNNDEFVCSREGVFPAATPFPAASPLVLPTPVVPPVI